MGTINIQVSNNNVPSVVDVPMAAGYSLISIFAWTVDQRQIYH